jgi:glycerol uptake facilitator-like aquaporin
MKLSLARRTVVEFIGTAFLVAAVIGSGIMAERLSAGNAALALLANTIATGAALVALILAFGPMSGAHLNPVVSVMDALQHGLPWRETPHYVIAQILGGIAGAIAAHLMFGLPLITLAHHVRGGPAQLFSEFIATFGLLAIIWGCSRLRAHGTTTTSADTPGFSFVVADPSSVAYAVGAYITAAYWFTSSTSFANPAVTIARSLSDTFAGIHPFNVPAFVIAQFLGAFSATLLFQWLLARRT